MTPLVKVAIAAVCVVMVVTALVVFVGTAYIFGSTDTRISSESSSSSLPLCVMMLSHWSIQYVAPFQYSMFGNSSGYFASFVPSATAQPLPAGTHVIENVHSYTAVNPGQTWLAVNESAYSVQRPQPAQLSAGCQPQGIPPIVYWLRALPAQNLTTETTTTISVSGSTEA